MGASAGRVDQQRLGGAADAGAAHLAVEEHGAGHVEIGLPVDVDVADAVEMGEDRDLRLALHPLHEAAPAAGHDHVDAAVEAGEHGADRRAVAGRHDLDRVGGQPGGGEALAHRLGDRHGAAVAVRAGAQDRGVAGLEAERPGIGGDVGAALEDHADHAERHGDALDQQAVRPLDRRELPPDRIGQGADLLDRVGDAGEALLVEGEPVDQRLAMAGGLRGGDVAGVLAQDLGSAGTDALGDGAQRDILRLRGGERHLPRGGAGAAADPGHLRAEVVGIREIRAQVENRHVRHPVNEVMPPVLAHPEPAKQALRVPVFTYSTNNARSSRCTIQERPGWVSRSPMRALG
ncbi:hypothetical protein IFDJLNFL_5634 [Methylobacterium dankookense]|uniref:Uncharacterized protein n=1 Tax=Methylobacterium dankookense TaxID=560405 RepID=A0ABQ4RPH5_9HYPH|nr:hypothetical protein IFDJLNFL_5634 [Methylobacterium dankookense]